MVDRLGKMVVESIEEEFLCEARNALILDQRVGDVVCRHTIQKELVVRGVLGLVLGSLKVVADEVPEGVTDQSIKVEQVNDIGELISCLSLRLQEVHASDNVFL